jgi:hypothetical protein
VLGTHNSYHQTPPQALIDHFGGAASPLLAWQYSHPPLTTQLDGGVRSFELDAYWDPQGGLYGQAAGLRIAGRNGWLSDAKYKQPGFKVGRQQGLVPAVAPAICWVHTSARSHSGQPSTWLLTLSQPTIDSLQTLHVPDFDTSTNCILLADCLAELKRWSDANPRHLPLRVYIEVKESGQLQEALGPALVGILDTMLLNSTAEGPSSFVQQPVNTAQTFRDLNAELASVFGADGGQLLTPDGLRKELGAAEGADLTQLLLQSPPGSGPWCVLPWHLSCVRPPAACAAACLLWFHFLDCIRLGAHTRACLCACEGHSAAAAPDRLPTDSITFRSLQPLAPAGAAARLGAGCAHPDTLALLLTFLPLLFLIHSPWPPLERLRGKVFVVLIVGRATSTEAKALYEAFPDLSERNSCCLVAASWQCAGPSPT